jgi:hypothetical protein
MSTKTGELTWLLKIEDTTEVLERCIRQSVRIARRSAKSLSDPGKTVLCIAGIAFPSTRMAAAAKKIFPGRELSSDMWGG